LSDFSAFFRLTAAGWRLVRADALLPRELDPVLPAGVRVTAKFLRLFCGRAAKSGRPGQRLAGSLETMGPAAIKLGQLLSTRADIFGDVFAGDLSHLKDRLAPFPLDQARAEIERALGQRPEALFTELGEPIAAASIAQAHPARLHDGRKVAVKVLRPGIERRIEQDSEALRLAARLVERHVPPARRLEPWALAETVVRTLELETDLRLEAGGADELRTVMNRDGYMTAPAVVWEGVARRVMTLEWADGAPLSDPASLEMEGVNREETGIKLVRAFLTQALDHGVFHADLHEGNLFLSAPDKLTAVDFGIIGRIGPQERRYLAEILWGFITRDYLRVAKAHFDAGYVPKEHSLELFAQALRSVGEPVIGRRASAVSMGRLLTQLFEITALFDMHLRPELVLLQKTMVAVEGVGRRLYPNLDIWMAAKPVVERYIARELSPVARAKIHFEEFVSAARAIVRMAERADRPVVVEPAPKRPDRLLWFALGAATTLAGAIGFVWAISAI
jgi:ubiquinone biosynthesis protein